MIVRKQYWHRKLDETLYPLDAVLDLPRTPPPSRWAR